MKPFSTDELLKLAVSTYGGAETIRYYQRMLKSAVTSTKTAMADQNSLLVAKNFGEIEVIVDKLNKLIFSGNNTKVLESVVKNTTK